MKRTLVLYTCILIPVYFCLPAAAVPLSDEAFIKFVRKATPKQVQKAIANGANVNAKDICDMTPLMWAATRNKDPEVLRVLIKAGAVVDAITNESSYMGNEPGLTALFFAAVNSTNPDKCAVLIEAGADVNAKTLYNWSTPLQYAAGATGCVDILRLLIKAGADVNHADHTSRTPLMDAARMNTPDIVSFLLDAGADPNKQDFEGETALTLSGSGPHYMKTVPLLLAKGANPNLRSKTYGQTAFMQLCQEIGGKEVELFIKAGADLKARDNGGNTALIWACRHISGKLAGGVIETLLKNGSDVNEMSNEGTSALMVAADFDLPEALPVLLKAGAEINHKNIRGETALMKAVSGAFAKSVKILLEAGADKTIKNNKGMTAYDYAKNPDNNLSKNPQVLKMLRP